MSLALHQPKIKQLLKQFNILYVEDDCELLDHTKELFELLFKEVRIAKDGVEAIKVYTEYFDLHDSYIDIVISDIEMPNMNGIEVSKQILELNKMQKIIITSGYDDKKYFIELINMGVDGFIQKPLLSEHIRTVLYDVCIRLEEEQALQKIISLSKEYIFNLSTGNLTNENENILLSDAETKCLTLLLNNNANSNNFCTTLEIFDYIYPFDKEFSSDIIKSLIKRLRKKLPKDCIRNIPNKGYYINL